jgi:hypothetical protein
VLGEERSIRELHLVVVREGPSLIGKAIGEIPFRQREQMRPRGEGAGTSASPSR